jgi:hypothetical protein
MNQLFSNSKSSFSTIQINSIRNLRLFLFGINLKFGFEKFLCGQNKSTSLSSIFVFFKVLKKKKKENTFFFNFPTNPISQKTDFSFVEESTNKTLYIQKEQRKIFFCFFFVFFFEKKSK